MNFSFQKAITIFLVTAILFVPLTPIFAQNNNQQPPRAIPIDENTLQPIQVNTNNQAGAALNGVDTQARGDGGLGGSLLECAGAGAVANIVKDYFSSLLSNAIGSVTGGEVPVGDNSLRSKESGTIGTLGISWDQVGYCAINTIIQEVGRATVAWINSGFQGNPVFVDNPEQFFADIADIQAGNFLNEISGGFLCSPIQNIVRVNLATRYNASISQYGDQAQCSFSGVSGNIEQFMSGETFSWEDWYSYTQVPSNNAYGATIYGNIELDSRIAQSLGVQSKLLDWGRGFLSFTDPETGKVSSPGAVVEGQLNQRLFSGESRLQMADEFDEVVNALVNQLIKVAINEVTQ